MNNGKSLNLLTDKWLPVRLQDGSVIKIIIADIGRSDIVDIVSPRADFRSALYQLLVGLLQTSFEPSGRKEWKKYWHVPPSTEELCANLEFYIDAFYIDSPEGEPAFMQDLELPLDSLEPIEGLFLGGPGENTRKNNTDLFVKEGDISVVGPYWTVIALFTFQINTAGGGSGHRVTLRGGGPITTLLLPPERDQGYTLWSNIWMNVLTTERFSLIHGNHEANSLQDIFPWMGKTRTSNKDEKTLPIEASPSQMFWPMPARIRVSWERGEESCDISGENVEIYASKVSRKNKGVNYSGNWIHPLTPYEFSDKQEAISIKGRTAGTGYRNWAQFVLNGESGKRRTEIAMVVGQYYNSLQYWMNDNKNFDFEEPRLWVAGFDLESAKAKCWYESVIPVFNLEADNREKLADQVRKMIGAASATLDQVKISLKSALFRDPKNDLNATKFISKSSFINANFWSATEADFYSILHKLVSSLDDEDRIDELLSHWRKTLTQQAFILFDQYALSTLNEDGDLKRIIKAREGKGGLQHYLNGSKVLKALVA